MSSSAVSAQPPRVQRTGGPADPAGQPGRSRWWQVSWSAPAALRAARATIVIPALFAITDKVIANPQMTLYAVFGGFATLVVTAFAGTRRDKLVAHAGLAVAGSVVIVIGTLASGSAWLAAVVALPLAFAVYYSGSAGPNAASGVTGCLFAFVLPIASAGSVGAIPSRLEGWWLAAAAGTAAVLALSPRSPGDRLRGQVADLARLLGDRLDGAVQGRPGDPGPEAVRAAAAGLRRSWLATPYRPIGLAAADQGLASLIELLEWCADLIASASDSHLDLPAAAAQDRLLIGISARTLHQIADVVSGQVAAPDLEQLWQARLASAGHLHEVAGDAALAVRRADQAYHAQTIGVAVSAAIGEALIAARRASPAQVAAQRRSWLANLPPAQQALLTGPAPGERSPWAPQQPGALLSRSGAISADASLRSVWFRNSARGAIALAAAVAVARLTDVQHAFWIVLGTLSVLRSSASATGATARRGLAGTVAGFAVGAALLVGIGTSPTTLWIAFPLAVLAAAYAPGTAPFVAGQAAFTVTIVVLFNLIAPAGWQVGLLRVEDVAIGCGVSLVVGFLFWPRGMAAVVGDNLADAYRSGASYLSEATRWALGDRASRPDAVVPAMAAGLRLDDAVRGYLTEQGSKRLSKSDLWALVSAAVRLRLTAHSMASLPLRTQPHSDDSGSHAALSRELTDLSGFYGRLAQQVARPGRRAAAPAVLDAPPPGAALRSLPPCGVSAAYRADALWVGHHLSHLQERAAELTGPARRLSALRRRPWWR